MDVRLAWLIVGGLIASGSVAAPPTSLPPAGRTASLIIEPAGEPIGRPVYVPRDEFATLRAWQVEPNVVGLARHSARLRVPTPEGREIEFSARRFDALEGFSIDDEGNLIVDDDPAKISFDWYGATGSTHAFLVVRRGGMHALIYGPDVRLTVSDEGTGTHWYRHLDPRTVDRGVCANDQLDGVAKRFGWHPQAVAGVSSLAGATRIDDPKYTARIRVLIYYTQAALQRYGSNLTTLNTAVDGLMLQLRESLANTGRTSHVNVELAAPLQAIGPYNEESQPPIADPRFRFGNHLEQLRLRDEDLLQGVRRSTVDADLAILLVNDAGNPSPDPDLDDPVYGIAVTQRAGCFGNPNCGLAPDAFRVLAYGVVSINVAVQNLTFAHEFGHLMGGVHDRNPEYPNVIAGAYADSFGHRTPGVGRDIMADPECINDDGNPDTPKQCLFRYPQFANPNAQFSPFLVPAGIVGQADVARTPRLRAKPTGNIYPVGENQTAPDLFWDGFEF